MHDVVDIVRVYSSLMGNRYEEHNITPKLFFNENELWDKEVEPKS